MADPEFTAPDASASNSSAPDASAPTRHHDISVTVRAGDIDINNHVNNAVYLRWVQDAATAHWEAALPEEITANYVWYVTRHEIDYRKPARLGDMLRVRTWVASMTAVVSERRCQIWRDADGVLLVETKTLWCAINPATGRPKRIDPRIPAALLA